MVDRVGLTSGATDQYGAYLAGMLIAKGGEAHGVKRRSSSSNAARVDHLHADPCKTKCVRYRPHCGGQTDATNLLHLVRDVQPARSIASRPRATCRSVSRFWNIPTIPMCCPE